MDTNIKPVLVPPTLQGPAGRAWSIDLQPHRPSERGTAVEVWAVEVPGSHPWWFWYRVALVHLRLTPGFPDPIIHLTGATHEIWVEALHPKCYPPSLGRIPSEIIAPMNFAAQFIAQDDSDASSRVHAAMLKVVTGVLNPDSDGRSGWVGEFNDSMIKK